MSFSPPKSKMQTFALPLVILAAILSSAPAAADSSCSGPDARTQPPSGAIIVDATGKYKGSFRTVSEGIKNIPNTTAEHTLFILPGVYHEQVVVPKFNGPLVLQGYTCNTMAYSSNQVTITHTMAQKDLPANAKGSFNELVSTAVFKSQNGVKVYNLNIANPDGKINKLGQAVAAYVDASNHGFYACNLTGYQDTLCANKGKELYARSYIGGAVDFVFGLQSKAWFESCDIESVGNGCITANGNSDSSGLSEYVFNNARVFGSGKAGSAYLGRPWRTYARVVWQNSKLSNIINPQGWQAWDSQSSTAHVFLREFNNSGPGAATGQRVSFSGKLSTAVDIKSILGSDYKSQWWVDTKYL